MKIKTAEEILKEWKFYQHVHDNSDMIKCMKEYATQFIDYASENVEVDYNFIGNRDENSSIEAFICRGEFDKIKELIK